MFSNWRPLLGVAAAALALASGSADEPASVSAASGARGPALPAVSGSDAFFGIAAQLPTQAGNRAPSASVNADSLREELFWAWDYHLEAYYQVPARMVHAGPKSRIFVEDGRTVSGAAIRELAELFEDVVYDRVRQAYGPDPDPGVDGEKAITLLLLDIRDPLYHDAAPHTYISGYFDPTNEALQSDLTGDLADRRSNEREMLYLDVAPTNPRSAVIRQTVAHEFAHLVLWGYDREEEPWLTEGLCELAVHLSGLGHPREHVEEFLADPDVTLVAWDGEVRDYGKVYLFMLYLYEQAGDAGEGWLRRLVASHARGMPSLGLVLPLQRPLPEVLRDYALALLLDADEKSGRFGFRSLELDSDRADGGFGPFRSHEWTRYPLGPLAVTVPPWSIRTDRFTLGRGALQVELTPSVAACVGAGSMPGYRLHHGATAVDTYCTGAGEPVAWLFPSFGVGGDVAVILSAVANASDVPLELELTAVPPVGIESLPLPVFVPFASAG